MRLRRTFGSQAGSLWNDGKPNPLNRAERAPEAVLDNNPDTVSTPDADGSCTLVFKAKDKANILLLEEDCAPRFARSRILRRAEGGWAVEVHCHRQGNRHSPFGPTAGRSARGGVAPSHHLQPGQAASGRTRLVPLRPTGGSCHPPRHAGSAWCSRVRRIRLTTTLLTAPRRRRNHPSTPGRSTCPRAASFASWASRTEG